MIIQCQGCAAKYFLPEDKVPKSPVKVSCPSCKAVFRLVPRSEPVASVVSAHMVDAPPPTLPSPLAPVSVEPNVVEAATVVPAPAPEKRKQQGAGKGCHSPQDRAKRLARVLVSDILWYNRDERDQAIQDGNLMTVLGDEINKSWELYKEKIGPELADSTNYFKEALNEILADGQEVF